MKHLKLFFACMLTTVLSIGQILAVDYELVYTLDGSVTSTASGSSAYATAIDIDVNDITWNVMGNTTLNPWGIGGKNLSSTGRSLFSKGSIDANIVKIDIEHGAASSVTVNAMTVEVATDADFTDIVSTCTPTFAANSTITVNHPDGDDDWSNCYYRITYSLTIGSSNKKVEFKSAKFYKEKSADAPVLESITISGDLSDKSYEEGESIDFSGLTATGHYSDESSDDLTDEVEWSFSPELTAGLTSVTITATLDEISGNKEISGLTVAEHVVTPGTYDITTDNDLWGTSYSGTASGINTLSGSKNDVSITINKNAGSNMYVTSSQTRIYSGYTMVFSVPNGYAITALQFTADGSNWAGDHTADVGTMTDNKNWSGEANSVTISVAGTCRMKAVKVTYAVAAPSKEEAGLAYAAADAQKLVKVGGSLVAPTLSNENNLTISYASSNTDIVEVNASTGAITAIKAAGKAIITASSEEDETYKAGEASYTIFVATEAGTAADPLSEASAKALIDLGCTMNVHVAGTIIGTPTYNETYHNYSVTLTDGFQFYRLKDLNNADFTSGYLKAGDELVAVGPLVKHSTTYELGEGCYLTSYTEYVAQLVDISNLKETAYTVAQALALAVNPTSDLTKAVYIKGVVYDVKNFNSTNGTLDIYIKDNGEDNKFEFFKCAGIYEENLSAFTAADNVQVGNEVIGYGVMKYYSGGSIWEFDNTATGDYLVDLQKPVTGVALDETAEAVVGSTVNLTATIQPSNATGTIVWSVTSGATNASVSNGVVTGLAEGEAVIRATVQGTEIYAECSVTITEASTPVSYDYALVTDAAQLQDGLKVIIVAAETDVAAGSAAATYRYVVDVERTTDGNYLILDSENMPTEFTLGVPAAGQYTFNDGNGYMYEEKAKSVKNQDDPFSWSITIGDGNIATIKATNELRYNSGSPRFTTYASGQQALQLFVKSDGKQAAGLAWSASTVELTAGETFTAPTLTNPNNLTVTIESDNTELATVTAGVVSLVENATGTATITASFAGDDSYRAASVSYTITVNSAEPPTPATYDYALVTDAAQLQDGLKVIIVAAETDVAAGSAAATYRNVVDVERTTDGNYLILDSENMPTEFTLGIPAAGQYTFNDGDGYMYESAVKSVKVQANPFSWSITIGEGNIATIQATNELRYNSGSPRFTTYASGQQALQLYVKDDGKQAAGLAWSTNAVELTTDETFTAPTLTNPNNLTVTIESNNTELATVTDGVVSLVENATGTAKITASYAGDDTYRAASVSYTITVSEEVVPPTPQPDAVAKVIVVAYDGKFYAMSTTIKNGTGFEPVEVEKEGGKIIVKTDAEAAAIQWQMAVGESTATFQNGENKYLACGSNSNTELALLDAASEWTWDAEASCYKQPGKDSKGRTFYYNYNSGTPIFRAYTVNGIGAEGYSGAPEFIAAENIEVRLPYESVRTELTAGYYYTMCLDKAVTHVRGASIWRVLSKAQNGTDIILEEVTGNLDAGRPYFFYATADKMDVVYTGDAVGAPLTEGNNGLVGSFSQEVIPASNDHYILYNNALYFVNTVAYVGANRAYLDMNGVPAYNAGSSAPGRRRVTMQTNGEQVATGMDEVNVSEMAVKMIIDGQLFILRGEKMYDATGRLVE